MKRNKIIIAIALVMVSAANAQITKGNWMVGGSGNFTSYESKTRFNDTEVSNKGVAINISPNVGYFIADKFAVGSKVSIGYGKPDNNENNFGYGVGPFVRYYFLKEDKLINLLAQASYDFGASKNGDNKSKSNGYGFKAGPVIFFNSSAALEITLEYNSSKLIPERSDSSTLNNIQIGLGFQIHLEK